MYGTLAKFTMTPENAEALKKLMDDEQMSVPGYVASHLLRPDVGGNEYYLAVLFEDKASYVKNADDPSQHERYLAYRELLEKDPEWTDGEWDSFIVS